MFPNPVIEQYEGIYVVRDDLLPGGTKARYLIGLFDTHDEIVYASPAYGGAQLALAYCARLTGKQATIFVAKRNSPHARTIEAAKVGARVYQVPHGYLNVVQARARKYAADRGAYLLPFGADLSAAVEQIATSARTIAGEFDEVWCAAGSGVLLKGLQRGLKAARYCAVQIGRDVENTHAQIFKSPLKFEQEITRRPPFPSCLNYDAKAWDMCRRLSKGKVLFWNVLASSPTAALEN